MKSKKNIVAMETQTSLFFLMITVVSGENKICRSSNVTPTAEPHFLDVVKSTDVRIHNGIYIQCCAENYDNITWFRKSLGHMWEPYPVTKARDPMGPYLDENRQVLQIKRSEASDNTTFQCNLIKDNTVKDQHVTRLWVVACDEIARGPRLTSPFPVDHYLQEVGGNITLYCTGYFGCSNFGAGHGLAKWYTRDTGKKRYSFPQNVSSRYSVTQFNRTGNTVLGSVLNIRAIETDDLHREFMCLISSAQEIAGATHKTVQIYLIPKTPFPRWIYWAIGGGVAALVLIVIISCFIHQLFGPQIRWFLRSCMSCLGPNPYKEDTYIYNVFLYHSEESTEDKKIAFSICTALKKENFNVRMSSDIMSGEWLMEANQHEVEQSALVIFLYTDDLMKCRFAMLFLQSLIEYRDGKGILFLVVDKYVPAAVRNQTIAAVENSPHSDIETDGNSNHGDMEQTTVKSEGERENCQNENQKVKNKQMIKKKGKDFDLKFWKALPQLQVPRENATMRQKNKFLCKLKNKIPLSKSQLRASVTESTSSFTRSSKGRHSSSGKPLLTSLGEAPNGAGSIENSDVGLISPNSDSVFTYDQINPVDLSLDNTMAKTLMRIDDDNIRNTEYRENTSNELAPIPLSNPVIVDVDVHGYNNIVHAVENTDIDATVEQGMFTMSGEETDANQHSPGFSALNSLAASFDQGSTVVNETPGYGTNRLVFNERQNPANYSTELSPSSVALSGEIKSDSSGYDSFSGDYGALVNAETDQENKQKPYNGHHSNGDVKKNELVLDVNVKDKPRLISSKNNPRSPSIDHQTLSPESGYNSSSGRLMSGEQSCPPFLNEGVRPQIEEFV